MPRVTINAGDVGLASVANDFAQLTYDQPRNGLINGSFEIWQRGTSGLATASGPTNGYGADRWQMYRGGYVSGVTGSQTSGTNQNRYAMRVQRTAGNTSSNIIILSHNMESANSKVYAGQEVTFSAWVRRGANYSATSNVVALTIISGDGTDQRVSETYTNRTTVVAGNKTLTTGWQRFSITGTVSSSASQLAVELSYTPTGTAGADDWFEITGAQLEIGAKPSTFQMTGGSVAAELAACQRYYYRTSGDGFGAHAMGTGQSSTVAVVMMKFPTTMRIKPAAIEYSGLLVSDLISGGVTPSSLTVNTTSNDGMFINVNTGGGYTIARPYFLYNAGTPSYLGFNAEV